jgi:hypothetical protein
MILQTGTPHVDVEEVRGPTKLGREREAHRLRDPLAASVRGARRRPPQVVFRIGKHSVLRGDELGENVGAFPATAIAHNDRAAPNAFDVGQVIRKRGDPQ